MPGHSPLLPRPLVSQAQELPLYSACDTDATNYISSAPAGVLLGSLAEVQKKGRGKKGQRSQLRLLAGRSCQCCPSNGPSSWHLYSVPGAAVSLSAHSLVTVSGTCRGRGHASQKRPRPSSEVPSCLPLRNSLSQVATSSSLFSRAPPTIQQVLSAEGFSFLLCFPSPAALQDFLLSFKLSKTWWLSSLN